jgi:short-subunit dehydrogenase
MDISEKVVIITGASEGIGLATARLFARQGASVALVARSAEKLQEIAAELPNSFVLPTDMRDESAVRQMVTAMKQHYGRIDILINNAGQGMHVPIEQANINQYRSIFELNVVSVLVAMQATIPLMREQGGGVIINISSGTSKMVLPGVGPYASTKYALNSITLTARQELAGDNIRVGLVHPGLTATAFHDNLAAGARVTRQWIGGGSRPAADTPEYVAEKILEAVQTEEAETYAHSMPSRA